MEIEGEENENKMVMVFIVTWFLSILEQYFDFNISIHLLLLYNS